ncbi:MAG: DUF4974 domain-containing protein [Balneolaceae bacterium]|nr:DUF4974 domain-containing protein [Balneolaceae bacterium]
MDEQHNIPNNDKDLKLARRIGDLLEQDKSIYDIPDPLIQQLAALKSHRKPDIPSEALWDYIDTKTQPSSSIHQLYSRHKHAFWTAAAVLLMAIAIGIFQPFSSSTALIAESGASKITHTLADGSTVTLRPHSRLYQNKDRAYSLEGEAHFKVIHNPGHPFTVTLPHSRITVLGTSFIASSWGQENRVYLEEGRVQFDLLNNHQSLILNPGQSAVATDSLSLDISSAHTYKDWMDNQLILQKTSLRHTFAELEQHFNIKLKAENPASLKLTIDGTLQLDTLDKVLSGLELVTGGSFQQIAPHSYLYTEGE